LRSFFETSDAWKSNAEHIIFMEFIHRIKIQGDLYMKAVGLVTEYNPFHNGHLYHLNKAMELTGADISVAVMSGDFVQRGELAVLDKYTRASMALNSGVNLVVELPVNYAVSSAESFAAGALKVLDYIKADSIAFGSESGNIERLSKLAHILCDNEDALYKEISKYTANGISYAAARQKVVEKLTDKDTAAMLTSSNNILAVEYLKAIIKNNYAIKPYTIKRQGDSYNDTDIRSEYASATALRGNLKADNISKYIPVKAGLILSSNTNYIYPDDITEALFTRLLGILFASSYDKNVFIENVMRYPDVNKEIAGRLYKSAMDMITRTVPQGAESKDNGAFSFGSLCEHIKTKEVPLSRIKRALVRITLGLDKKHMEKYANEPYIRVLGFDKKGQEYLSYIRKTVEVPLITKIADYKEMLLDDIHAANIYNMIVAGKYGVKEFGDFVRGPVRV
ncbi:MAG TPA: nucleotidyltransferase, partial [Eubacterium sp.]|nr:nucleotidyltransferase [Eubacterium sp.]